MARFRQALSSLAIGFVIVLASGCGAYTPATNVSERSSQSNTATPSGTNTGQGLQLYATSSSVGLNQSITLVAYGGAAPYTYSILSGQGTINASTGVYTAPGTAQSVTLQVADGASSSATIAISVVAASAISISPTGATVPPGQSLSFSAVGGTAPYTYAVVAGSGTFNGTIYTAPGAQETDTVQVTDAVGTVATTTVIVSSAGLISLASQTISTGQTIALSASGGTSPYTYSIVSGGGTLNGNQFTAGVMAGSTVIQVADATGAKATATLTINANYTTTQVTTTFSIVDDMYVAFSFDNSQGNDHPSFSFFGEGPGADAIDVAKNTANCATYFGLVSPCINTFGLSNFSNSSRPPVSYRGSISITGRDHSANYEFCIPPTDGTIAYIHGDSGPVMLREVNFYAPLRVVFNGKSAMTAFAFADGKTGAGSATVSFNGGYTTDADCSGFDPNSFIQVTN